MSLHDNRSDIQHQFILHVIVATPTVHVAKYKSLHHLLTDSTWYTKYNRSFHLLKLNTIAPQPLLPQCSKYNTPTSMVSSHQQASPGWPTSALKPSPGAPPSALQGFADPWAASVVFRNQVQLEPPLHSQCIQPQQDQVAEHSNCYQPRLQNYSLMGCLFHSRR